MYYIGVDVGGMSIKVGLVDVSGNILKSSKIETENISAEDQVRKIGKQILKLLSDNDISKNEIVGIGLGCPGSIKKSDGSVMYSANLKWTNLPLKRLLEEETGLKVRIANDADVAGLGEVIFGVAKEYSDAILLTIGTGVGGGIIIDNKIYEGFYGMAGELGHITLFCNGLECGCGRKGCFEQYASATALIRITKEKMLKNTKSLMWKNVNGNIDEVNGITAFASAKENDLSANEVVDEFVSYLSEGILNYCNIFRPQAIIIGGGISKEGDYLINKIKKYCEKYAYGYKGTSKPEILCAKLGNDAGIIGAAALMVE